MPYCHLPCFHYCLDVREYVMCLTMLGLNDTKRRGTVEIILYTNREAACRCKSAYLSQVTNNPLHTGENGIWIAPPRRQRHLRH